MLKKIDHIGLAVRSLDQARRFYEEVLGLSCEKVEEVASQQVRVAFFKLGEVYLELLEPTSESSPIARFLESRGEGVHHISYEVGEAEDGAGAKTDDEADTKSGAGAGAGAKAEAGAKPEARAGGLEQVLHQLQEKGCRLINETPVAGAGGKDIAFLHPRSTFGVLTELAAKRKG